jgi:UDP-glucose 4-epimerase
MKNAPVSLVTGGAGFMGSHVADHLINMGHTVVVLDDLSGGFKRNINKKAIFVKGSITNTKLLGKLFSKYHFDYIFHLAAYAAEGLSHFIRRFNYENNLIGSINLINRAIKYNIKHFVFTSSIAVYGTNQTPMTEDLTPIPEDCYGIAKYAVELDLKAANKMFGLTYTIFRPHNVYGVRQNHGDPYRNVIGIFMNQVMNGLPMTIFGAGTQTRAFSYIDDVAPYIAKCINIPAAKNETINIGADIPYTVLDLAKLVAEIMGVKPKLKFLAKRIEVEHAFSNHDKAKKIFNIKKQSTSLEEGIRKMAEWVKKIGPRKPIRFRRAIEVAKNMPSSWKRLMR